MGCWGSWFRGSNLRNPPAKNIKYTIYLRAEYLGPKWVYLSHYGTASVDLASIYLSICMYIPKSKRLASQSRGYLMPEPRVHAWTKLRPPSRPELSLRTTPSMLKLSPMPRFWKSPLQRRLPGQHHPEVLGRPPKP